MPSQRPSANELLQHRFIKSARKTSYLTELIERYTDYRARSPKGQQMYQPTVRNSMAWNGSMRSEWDFDTIRSSTSAMGTYRSMAKDLEMPPGMVPEEDEDRRSPGAFQDMDAMQGELMIDEKVTIADLLEGMGAYEEDQPFFGRGVSERHSSEVSEPLLW